jgi:hypothetical protein
MATVDTRNFQPPLNFEFAVDKLTDFNYFVQKINVPDLSIGLANNGGATPFSQIAYTGDHLGFGDLSIDFKVNEGMYNWYEIFSWMQGIGFPENIDQYGKLKSGTIPDLNGDLPLKVIPQRTHGLIYGQGTLIINSSQNEPVLKISFIDMHPISLGELSFDTRESDVLYATASVTFKYDYYTVEKL